MQSCAETGETHSGTIPRKRDFSLSMQAIKLLEQLADVSQNPSILTTAIKQIREDDLAALNWEFGEKDEE